MNAKTYGLEDIVDKDKLSEALITLHRVSLIVNSSLRLDEVLDRIIASAAEVVRAEASSILLIDEERRKLYFEVARGDKGEKVKNYKLNIGEGIAGWVAETGKPMLVRDAAREPRHYAAISREIGYEVRNLLCVPLLLKNKVIGVVEVINKISEGGFGEDDIPILQAFANQAAIAIENARLYEEVVETEQLRRELEIAHQMQMKLLPQSRPVTDRLELAGVSHPAKAVEGDYYDYFWVDDDHLGVVIADVSGKSVSAAFYMTMVRGIVRSNAIENPSARDVVLKVNAVIPSSIDEADKFVTMLYAIVHLGSGRVTFCSAGHNPLIHFDSSSRECHLIKASGIPIGVTDDPNFEEGNLTLDTGDILIFYTDGITEARNREGKMYGIDRLKDLVARNPGDSADELLSRIESDAERFIGGAELQDDMTLIVAKMR
ncbi:MAG: PP2C family protein-serine/threonine phosphatase [bacterium]